MIFSLLQRKKVNQELTTSRLFSEKDFYTTFSRDLLKCQKEVIIESPFVTACRMEKLNPIFEKLLCKGVKITLLTRDPIEHDEFSRHEATNELLACKEMGVHIVLLRGKYHRKLAIIDRSILWEGSLNILSHGNSKEIMRRIEGKKTASEMFQFLNLAKIL